MIKRCHINTGKYLSISYYENLPLSLIHLFCCAKYSMKDDMYNRLDNIMAVMKRTVVHKKQSIGESCNRGKSPLILGAYRKMCQVLISCNKPDNIFTLFFKLWSGLLWPRMITVLVCTIIILSGMMVVLLCILPFKGITRRGEP